MGFHGRRNSPTGPMETLQGTAEVVQASVGRGAGICLLPARHPLPCPSTLYASVFSKFGNTLASVCLALLPFPSRTPILHLLVDPQFPDAISIFKKLFFSLGVSFYIVLMLCLKVYKSFLMYV